MMRNTPLQTLVHGLADLIATAVTQSIQANLDCSSTEATERFQHALADLFPIPQPTPPSPPAKPVKRQRGSVRDKHSITPKMIAAAFYERDGHVFYRVQSATGYRPDTEAGTTPNPKKPNDQCVISYDSQRFQRAHVVFCLHHGRWPTQRLAHLNFDRTDDRIENIIEATHAEICRTSRVSRRNKFGVKGVAYDPVGNASFPYRTRINRHGIRLDLGKFATASECHRAYCDAANKLHGRFNPSSGLYEPELQE